MAKLNRGVTCILNAAEIRDRWVPIGFEPSPTAPAGFDKIVAEDIATFTRIARAANIKAN